MKIKTIERDLNESNIGVINFEFNSTAAGAELCRNIVIAAKENSADIAGLRTYNKNKDFFIDITKNLQASEEIEIFS